LSKRTRVILIVVAVAVAGYLAWRWYQNSQSGSGTGNTVGTDIGSNLNSPAPVLEGGSSSGDNSAPSYSAGSETINVELPNGDQSTTAAVPPKAPVKTPPKKSPISGPPPKGKPIKSKTPPKKIPVKK
jgi:hypothetical protein